MIIVLGVSEQKYNNNCSWSFIAKIYIAMDLHLPKGWIQIYEMKAIRSVIGN